MVLKYIKQAQLDVIIHAKLSSSTPITLRMCILDLETRIMERSNMSNAEECNTTRGLDQLIELYTAAAINHALYEECPDIELKLKILDLRTRIAERKRLIDLLDSCRTKQC